MMSEAAEIKTAANPHEVLLVADALTGQDAVNLARSFDQRVGLTGIVLTRVDGDGRGGAALSMRAVTGKPIKLIGTGEKTDALEDFHPSRIAGPHSRHGRRGVAGGEGRREYRCGKGRAHRRADAQGSVRPQRHARAAAADGEHGRHLGVDGHDARHRQDEEPDRGRRHRRQDHQAPGRDHQLDDARRSAAIRISSKPAARSASPPAPAKTSSRSTSS